MTKQASHLLDEPPILVYPSLAKAMGINKAIIFQQLHFLLNATKVAQTKNNFVDNRWWVYNSYPQWQEKYFPWLSIGAIKRLFLELEREGFVLSKQSVKSKADRRKWYSIDYTTWEQFVTTIGTNCDHPPSAQFETVWEQNETMDGNKMSQSITETTTETPTEKKEKAKKAISQSKKKKATPRKKANRRKSWQQYTVSSAAAPATDEPTEDCTDLITEGLEQLRKTKYTSREEKKKYVRRTQPA